MKKIIFLLFAFITTNQIIAQQPQQRIKFNYDAAGNQTKRFVAFTNAKLLNDSIKKNLKEVSELEEDDLLKFSSEDVISFYPNPVKEELYLKWELINENKVTNIEIFNLNGKLMNSLKNLEKENTQNISFYEYPKGTYFVLLNYRDGEQKSITIVKE